MRWIAAFTALCGLLIAGLVWRLATAVRHTPPTRAVRTSAPEAKALAAPLTAPVNDAIVAEPDGAAEAWPPAAADVPAEILAPDLSSTRPAIQWADERRDQAVLRQLAAAREVLAREPSHPRALADEYAALRTLRRWWEAADALARRVALEPENIALRFEYAESLIRLQHWTSAVDVLRNVVSHDPNHAPAWHYLAAAQQALGHLENARQSWTRVIELTPADPTAYVHRGEVLLAQRDGVAAAADFQQALRLDPANAETALSLSLAWSAAGEPAAAERVLLDLVARAPRHVRALNRLAEIAWQIARDDPTRRAARLEVAIAWCRRSLEVDSNQPAVQTLLEKALLEQKQP